MKALPTPRRFLNALMPPHLGGLPPEHRTEPVLGLAPMTKRREDSAPRPCWADLEQALDEGSRRVYQTRNETEVIERSRR